LAGVEPVPSVPFGLVEEEADEDDEAEELLVPSDLPSFSGGLSLLE